MTDLTAVLYDASHRRGDFSRAILLKEMLGRQ